MREEWGRWRVRKRKKEMIKLERKDTEGEEKAGKTDRKGKRQTGKQTKKERQRKKK